MTRWSAVILVALAAAGVGAPAGAQTAPELVEQGISSYRDLEMEAAVRLLRLALAARDLAEADRLNALAYLGAAEFYRDRRDSSRAAFRRLILRDPRYRLDRQIFPPDVWDTFEAVRRATPVVALDLPVEVRFVPGRGGLGIGLYTSAPHRVRVRIESRDGRVVRTLHDGRAGDSVRVTWDGRAERRRRLDAGLYTMSVASLGGDGAVRRTVEVPVRLAYATEDSTPHPRPPRPLPERAGWGPGLLRLGLGVGAGLGALVIVPVFTDNDGPKYATAVVLTAAGVIGFFEKRPGRPYPDNVVANETARAAWRARVERVIEENRRRQPGERIILETGRPVVRGG